MVILQRFHNRSVHILRTEEELPSRSCSQPARSNEARSVTDGGLVSGGFAGGLWKTGHGLWHPAHCQVELPLPACPAGAVCQPCLRPARPPNTLPPPPPAQLLSSARHSSAVLYRSCSGPTPPLQQHLHHQLLQLFPAFTRFAPKTCILCTNFILCIYFIFQEK